MSDDSKKTRGEPENAKKFYGTNLPFNSQAPLKPTPKRKRLSQEEHEEEKCRYCGGDCPNDEDHACDGYLGDIDGLYAKECEEKND